MNTQGAARDEYKRISISSKRQITIPQKYYEQLGFGSEAECTVRGGELVLRPAAGSDSGEFAEEILSDLLSQGYSGDELLAKFKETRRKIRPAVESMIAEADAEARREAPSASFEEIFGKGE